MVVNAAARRRRGSPRSTRVTRREAHRIRPCRAEGCRRTRRRLPGDDRKLGRRVSHRELPGQHQRRPGPHPVRTARADSSVCWPPATQNSRRPTFSTDYRTDTGASTRTPRSGPSTASKRISRLPAVSRKPQMRRKASFGPRTRLYQSQLPQCVHMPSDSCRSMTPTCVWAAEAVLWAAENPLIDGMSYHETTFPMGADRAAAAALPLLLLAPFDNLKLDRSRIESALESVATSLFDEVRAIYVKGCEPVWDAPCDWRRSPAPVVDICRPGLQRRRACTIAG